MRRMILICLTLLFVFALSTGVCAASEASLVEVTADVATDGSCQVSVSVAIHLEGSPEEFEFPIPADARDVKVNGTDVNAAETAQLQRIDLTKVMGRPNGDVNFRVQYTLPNVLSEKDNGELELDLPLLSGFAYPIASVKLQVNLPAAVSTEPEFSSGYYQTRIEEILVVSDPGTNQITAQSNDSLEDTETLTMTLDVEKAMFPDVQESADKIHFDEIAMIVCGVLAFLYWVLFLRMDLVRRQDSPVPPQGYSAGEVGSVLTLRGADLPMMIFTWAQLGYILIQLDRHNRVILHKRMDMGNERSSFERKFFRALFGKKTVADTSTTRFAMLCKKAEQVSPDVRVLIRRGAGNPALFRVLGCGVAAFGGLSVGLAITTNWFLSALFTVLGGISGWHIHRWTDSLLLRKGDLRKALIISGVWLLVSALTGSFWVGVSVVLSQMLVGVLTAFGCRRTETGTQAMAQLLGLRRYLKTMPREEAKRHQALDPEYFHDMAPYALALGVDRRFARGFGSEGIAACPYLTTGMDGHRSAAEWTELMRKTVNTMEASQRRLPMERLRSMISK